MNQKVTYENRLQVAKGDNIILRRFRNYYTDYAAKYALKLPDHLAIVRIDGWFQVVPTRGERKVYDYGELVFLAAYNVNPASRSPHEAWKQFMEQDHGEE